MSGFLELAEIFIEGTYDLGLMAERIIWWLLVHAFHFFVGLLVIAAGISFVCAQILFLMKIKRALLPPETAEEWKRKKIMKDAKYVEKFMEKQARKSTYLKK